MLYFFDFQFFCCSLSMYNYSLLHYYFQILEKINQMTQDLYRDRGSYKQFDESEVSMEVDEQVKSSSQNSSGQPSQEIEDEKQFPMNEKVNTISKFPFHHYLRQHYKRLSLQQQIHIFQNYFKCPLKTDTELIIQSSHIELLNEGLNLFTKLSEDPVMFLLIQKYNETKQILTIKNQKGQIVHFQIVDYNKKRCTIIGEIKRKLKGRAFIIINDQSTLSQIVNKKTLNKLACHSNFLFFKHIKNTKQLEDLKKEFFISYKKGRIQLSFLKVHLENEKSAIVNLDGEKFYAFSHQNHENVNINQLAFSKLKNQFFQQFQVLIQQEKKLITTDTRALEYNVRLRMFDYMYINFLKSTGKDKQYFFFIVQKMARRTGKLNKDSDTENDHYPQKIFASRRCKCCEILDRGRNKKSKFKCIGCSIKYQTDIPLCIKCFEDFHQEILPKCGRASVKNLKRAYDSHFNKRSCQIQKRSKQSQGLQKKIENNEQIKKTIIELDQNMNQIQKLMGELQDHSFSGAKIVKQFNQVLFLNIIQNFNYILEHEQQSNQNDQSKNNIEGPIPTNPSNISQNS